ncbi:hypothetical protein F5Y12DRAFT_82087 [Xylaria sp. FL1777]|nr:hypothetical protein F5Y12DRAFT_82087 [Xylaria sp. FL1777]
MNSKRGLLLVPWPPQSTTYSDIWTALYPSIQSTIKHIHKAEDTCKTCVLEIAIPITRISEAAQSQQDLFKRINSLVTNIYRLISTICRELKIPHGILDARVLLVQDDLSLGEEKTYPFGVIDYAALAVSDRPWTHVFAVESESGEEIFRKFSAVAREYSSRCDGLFAGVRRVASGMQVYVPASSAPISSTTDFDSDTESVTILESIDPERLDSPRHIVVVISGDIQDQFHDKYLLTMALFGIGMFAMGKKTELVVRSMIDAIEKPECVSVVVSKGVLDHDLKMQIWDFVAGTLNGTPAKQPDDEQKLQLEFYTCEEMNKKYAAGMVSTLVVSDAYSSFPRKWAALKGNASIILGSAEPVHDDVDN